VESASASSIECVVKMIEDYFLLVAILDITSHINLLASGSIPVDGSSRNTIGGLPIIAIATDNFLLFPPDNYPASIYSNLFKSISCIFYSTKADYLSLGIPLIAANNSKCSITVRFSNNASNCGQYPIFFLA